MTLAFHNLDKSNKMITAEFSYAFLGPLIHVSRVAVVITNLTAAHVKKHYIYCGVSWPVKRRKIEVGIVFIRISPTEVAKRFTIFSCGTATTD